MGHLAEKGPKTFGRHQRFVNHGGVAKMRRKKNAIGANDRPLTYSASGSYRHFVAHCPDSWENVARENRKEINSMSIYLYLYLYICSEDES